MEPAWALSQAIRVLDEAYRLSFIGTSANAVTPWTLMRSAIPGTIKHLQEALDQNVEADNEGARLICEHCEAAYQLDITSGLADSGMNLVAETWDNGMDDDE